VQRTGVRPEHGLRYRLSACPRSRRSFKRDIEPVTPEGLENLYRQLRDIQLTTYQYKDSPAEAPRRLGFIIDDTKSPLPVNPDGNTVDLYGYLSMAVAAIQVQSRQIESLRTEVARLHGRSSWRPDSRPTLRPVRPAP
jgi:hypothetical protein